MNSYVLLESINNPNTFIIVFSPDILSVNSELNIFLEQADYIQPTLIKMDLISFTGDRPERYVQFEILGNCILDNSFVTGREDTESSEATQAFYASLPIDYINRIYPIHYRKALLNQKPILTQSS